jgi:inhibitor of KinA sporulation pathway (predicted exonuclease)
MRPMISLDLELEQPRSEEIPDSLTDEERIIQVGWVVFDPLEFKVHETVVHHTDYLHTHGSVSDYIRTLTHITDEDMRNGIPLEEIYEVLVECRETYDTSRIVCQWGSGDMECLRRELPEDTTWEFGHGGLNVKHMYMSYAGAMDMQARGGLSKSMARLGLSWSGGPKHQAHVDALNTAKVYSHLLNQWRKEKE